ncbi:bifunctional hydroxymethylpyrimidine kinase/phosphomethylpyrimidine kinase [Listeria ivanovii]|uniref:bifunctional hydroxymethylpyrimidine kinase/phosphomethylpyrimidine kinase n=1 Tax=Listeria ivanovii TaxID=1638 RepID=UPI001941B534|nr:bifunctional hydroxymethylpyrimidine kinase/phosphomethylpyrimidine kinase [Listeria ivanovii]MBM5720696.1 bifunctional hydroxymethylpyrimidine kinase/phosphomethylpyrimidine kinase [Listeria ivanovii]
MTFPQALTIAGSDSGGGAGIQADIKTFQECSTFGMSVITAITAQNTLGVKAVHKVPVEIIREQCSAIAEDFEVRALKTGMLVDAEIIREVVRNIRLHQFPNIVIDPVMIAKGGTVLLEDEATQVLKEELLPLGTVITPNIPEAESIIGAKITTKTEIENAAKKIQKLGVKAVVIKGGHSQMAEAVDYFYDGETSKWLASARIDTPHTHGTGCTFSACIVAELAKGNSLFESVTVAKNFITSAIKYPIGIGHGHGPTNHFAYRMEEGQ